MVLIFSAAANASRQIVRELKLADDAEKTVLPIRIEEVSPSGNFAFFLGAAQFLETASHRSTIPASLPACCFQRRHDHLLSGTMSGPFHVILKKNGR